MFSLSFLDENREEICSKEYEFSRKQAQKLAKARIIEKGLRAAGMAKIEIINDDGECLYDYFITEKYNK